MESHFLKGNSPDGLRALWIKHTVLVPAPDAAVAEVWAIAFMRATRDGPVQKLAAKRTFPLREATVSAAPFRFSLPNAELGHGYARGALLGQGGPQFRWDLSYPCPEIGFRPYPTPRMYEGSFPRSKTLTPVPSTRIQGFFEVEGERWDVRDYLGAQGHNWGSRHAQAYAWAHVNGLGDDGDAWLEALTGKVRLGPLTTPWLSVAAIHIAGQTYRFDGPRAMLARSVAIDARSYAFKVEQEGARLEARFHAPTEAFAGLRYVDPQGGGLDCLNSKLACAEVTFTVHGRTRTLRTDTAALELGTRLPGHGVAILV